MAEDKWYPGRDIWRWTKDKAKAHPSLAGAIIGAGAAVAVVGTGGVGLIVAVTAAAAGSGIAKNIATDPGKDEVKK